jgi:trimeric autotransporter adhesin
VLNTKVNTNAITTEALAARAKDVSTTAATAAQNAAAAAQTAAQTATMAAQEVGNAAQQAAANVNKGVFNARVWAAPQLENAADYTTTTLAPKVSAALRSTARQISPEDVQPKRSSSVLTWSFLAAAVLAAAGAAAVVIRIRYRTAMAADTEEEATAGTAGGTTDPAGSPAADAAGTTADSAVNGRVSSSGR